MVGFSAVSPFKLGVMFNVFDGVVMASLKKNYVVGCCNVVIIYSHSSRIVHVLPGATFNQIPSESRV